VLPPSSASALIKIPNEFVHSYEGILYKKCLIGTENATLLTQGQPKQKQKNRIIV
jgi:hypothetical protein